jgi:hypothetical protein
MTAFVLKVCGSLFVAAAAMLWLGWTLLRVRPLGFFLPRQFAEIRADYRRWIWLYRVHIFGYLVTIMGAAALAAAVQGPDARVLIWPGLAVLAIGSLVGALGAAFYYHMGAWGALDLEGRGEDEITRFIASLKVLAHYATCLVRFGRVFFGLGQVVLAAGLLHAGTLPGWVAVAAGLLGLAAIGVTMAKPDELERYRPIFHLNAAWMLILGLIMLRAGLGASS